MCAVRRQEADVALGSTSVDNLFMMEYLASAPGEFVKVYLYGLWLAQYGAGDGTLEEIALGEKIRLQKAGESYEALMTNVRPDLGDNMSKAFASVDGIIESLGLEADDENRRHVRILAYNRIEISITNLDKVAKADSLVTGVLGKMKPAAVLDMIRNGINPLEKSFDEIEKFLDERTVSEEGYGKASENYAEFLYALDKNRDISSDERESYIGIYRMLDKIGKKDGAAIGAVVNTGAELTFSNLLAAVRSSRFRGMDYRVDENTGFAQIVNEGRSITDQITASFAASNGEYYEEKAADLRRAGYFAPEAASFTESAQEDLSAENLIAADNLLSSGDDLYKTLLGESKKKTGNERLSELAENAVDMIAEAEDGDLEYIEILKEFGSASEEVTFAAGELIDVRAMQQVHRQISLAVRASEKGADEYFVPVDVAGEVTKVRVRFKASEDGSSGTDISFTTPSESNVTAHFEINEMRVSGNIYLDSGNEVKKIEAAADIFIADLTAQGYEVPDGINVMVREGVLSGHIYETFGREADTDRREGAGRRVLFGISRDFLKAVKESFL